MINLVTDRNQQEFPRLKEKCDGFLGYPRAKDVKYSDLAPFLDVQIDTTHNSSDHYTTHKKR